MKIYFASDFHLGIVYKGDSLDREKIIVRWLDEIKKDATEIYLLGDIFDFWFEYKNVVPKGYVRLLGKLAEITDMGIPVHFFLGNHDMWMKEYFQKELNIIIHKKPLVKEYNKLRFLIGHGDGLGPGDYGYKFIKVILRNKICRFLFSNLHPRIAFTIANFFSALSRKTHIEEEKLFKGEEERLLKFAKKIVVAQHYNFIILGHRHLPLDIKINENTRYLNAGDWIRNFSYIVFDGSNLELKKFNV